jgi:hypothetical protein
MRIVQLMTDRSRYFNPSKNYWFSFIAFLISLFGLYFRVVLVNTARPDGAFFFRRLIHSLKTYDSTVLVYRQTKAEIVGESINESTNTPNVYVQCVGIFYYRSRKSCLLNCLINVV